MTFDPIATGNSIRALADLQATADACPCKCHDEGGEVHHDGAVCCRAACIVRTAPPVVAAVAGDTVQPVQKARTEAEGWAAALMAGMRIGANARGGAEEVPLVCGSRLAVRFDHGREAWTVDGATVSARIALDYLVDDFERRGRPGNVNPYPIHEAPPTPPRTELYSALERLVEEFAKGCANVTGPESAASCPECRVVVNDGTRLQFYGLPAPKAVQS